jgi:uncharacterized membrane protein
MSNPRGKQNLPQPKPQGKLVQVTAAQSSFSGPLPPPEILEKYDQVYPGAAKIILDAFQSQGDHRQSLERTVVKQGSRDSLIGLIFAFIIGMTTILSGAYCITIGQPYAGAFLGGSGLTGLVGTFIYGSRQRRQERESRAKEVRR